MLQPRSNRSLLTNLIQSLPGLMLTLQLSAGTASAQVLVGNPYVTGFEGWMSTYTTAPTQVGPGPSWGVLLTPDPLSGQRFLFEAGDGREADSVTTAGMADGKYKPYLMINTADTTPANYNITYQLASMDNDGFGVVWGYQDNDNYFRAGFREQADGNLGFEEGTSVQKVVNGVITNLANSQAGFVPPSTGATFDVRVVVNGTNWDVQVNNTSILSGSDPDLKPGKYGVHSWAQREVGTTLSTPTYGTMVGPISVASATLNKTTNFVNALPAIPWRRIGMTNAVGEMGIFEGEDYGNFALDFTNGTIRDDSNGFANATASAPNTDFIGPAIVIDSAGSAAMTNYRFTTRVENQDNDGIGLLVRVADDGTFYRINWATEGPGAGTTRPPLGMSVQKYQNATWTQVFTETTPKFLPADSVPFDVSVQLVGNSMKIDVLEDPNGVTRAFSYDTIVDSAGPILSGSVGLTNWGNGDGGNGAVYSAFGGTDSPLVSAISNITDLKLTVNRSTSNVTLTNSSTVPINIKQVSILSDYGGALATANWNSISDNYDEAPGNGSVDPDDPWTELTTTAFELTEREQSVGGNGGTLTAGEVVNLGNIWQKSKIQDIALRVELTDGSVYFSEAAYTAGPGGVPFTRSDLNLDGMISAADWAFYYPNMLVDMSSMTNVQRALAGDLDLDGDNDVNDFILFKADFEAAVGVGSFEAMLAGLPEPSTLGLLCLATICLPRLRRGRVSVVIMFLTLTMILAQSEKGTAADIDFTTFTVEHFPESDVGNFPLASWTATPMSATLNADASVNVFYSPLSPLNKHIRGTITPGTDDDVVGLVFGFEPGDAQLGSTADYILLDWKGANQTFNFADAPPIEGPNGFHNLTAGGNMPVGLAISRVTGRPTADEFWQHLDLPQTDGGNQGGVQQLARGATLGGAAYNRTNGSHTVEVVYTASTIQVSVDGVQQIDISGNFPDGRFGLYTLNQGPSPRFDNFEIFDFNALRATVDRSTGNITLRNDGSAPIEFDYYQIDSPSSSLNVSGWNSLSDQNFQSIGPGLGQSFDEAGGSSNSSLAEVFLQTQTSFPALGPNSMVSLGAAYNGAVNGEDLVLRYRLPSGGLFSASIEYIGTAPTLQGDYNTNGVVDAADYVVWRKTDGANPAGYNTWRANFGRTGGGGAALDGAASVPEPASIVLLLGVTLLGWSRRKNSRTA